MKVIFVTLLFCCLLTIVKAQTPVFSRSIKASAGFINTIGGREQQQPGFYCSLLFGKQLTNKHWSLETGLSYVSNNNREKFADYDYYFTGDNSRRVSAELILFYNVLARPKLLIRLGAGPSVWYQRNGLVGDLSGLSNGKQIESISFDRIYTNEVNVGINCKGTVEYQVTPRIVAGLRAGLTGNLLPADAKGSLIGNLGAFGLSVGYGF